jgi:hypothetical protein
MSPLVDLALPCSGDRWNVQGCPRQVGRGWNGCFAEPISGHGHLRTKVEQIRERTRFRS